MRTIQTCGSFDHIDDIYSLTIAFEHQNHAITLDGLSKEDLEELKSCIDCLVGEPDLDTAPDLD